MPGRAQQDAFTLVEILTATAVLALLLALMLQIVNGILQSTKIQNQQMEATSAARRVLDVVSQDLQGAIVGEDVSILVATNGGDFLLGFLTSRHGTNGSADHRFLAVEYATNGAYELCRHYASVPFSETALFSAITNATNGACPLAVGILGIRIRAVTEATNLPVSSGPSPNWATTSYNGNPVPDGYAALITTTPDFAATMTNRTRALEVWLAAVDDQNYRLLSSLGALATVSTLLSTTNHPSSWRDSLDAASLPGPAKSAIRILTKTITLP